MGKIDIGATIGNLEIVGRIGAGGMGVVWKARHVHLTDMWRAVKTLPEDFASKPELVQRFQQEARTMSTLDHPGLVRLHDFGSHEGTYYLVMDYVEGHSLGALMRRRDGSRRKYHPVDATQIVKEVCSALAYAHGKGIVHRDIKPGNVLMEAASHRARLSDFGVAAMLEGAARPAADPRQGRLDLDNMQTISGVSPDQLSGPGQIVGTLDYMSPEQRAGQKVDARSDLFSVGVMFYEMLMGEMPVGRFELPGRVLSSDVYPQALDGVIEGLLKPKAAVRIASAEQVINLISSIRWPALADGPGSATPIEEIERQEHDDWLEKQSERRAQGFPPEPEPPRRTFDYDCPGCEAAVRSDWFFCVECGEKLRMDMRQCPRCKGYPPPGSSACQFCGQQFGQ